MGAGQGLTFYRWHAMLKTAESIRTGDPQERIDYAARTPEASKASYRRRHPPTLQLAQDTGLGIIRAA